MQKLEKEALPKIREDIENLIKDIKEDLLSCNPLSVLENLSYAYGMTTPEKLMQDIDTLKSSYLEYLHSLITSLEEYNFENEPNDELLKRVQENIENLHTQVIFYFMIIGTDKEGLPDKNRFLQMTNHLVIKGLSYSSHQFQLCKELFSNYDEKLISKYGVTAKKLIDELEKIIEYPVENFNIQIRYFTEMKKSHEEFKIEVDKAEKENRLENFMGKFKNSESIKQTNKKLQEIYDETGRSFNDSLFKIHDLDLPKELLDDISLELGENSIFSKGEIDSFPINNSLVYEKPLIKKNDEYYCFNSTTMTHTLHLIIENTILNLILENKRAKQYYKKKGDYLEEKSLELIQNILPNSKSYINLKYNEDDEVDGILIYDNNVFIVEAKSNKFTLEAKKGSLDRIKRNTKDIVEKAYQQALRAKNFILSNEYAEFKDKNKKTILTIDTKKIKNIYLINTTLEPLMHLTSNLNSLKEFGFIQEEDWIWSVYLNDLRIIAKIVESPTEFLVYLERRIKFNDYPQIQSMEEIDIFGYFLNDGLYFDDIDFPEENYSMVTHGFTEPIDKYFLHQEGYLDEAVKKQSFINKSPIKNIIKKLEKSGIENFSMLSKFLLSFSRYDQGLIAEQTNHILLGKKINFSTALDYKNIGFTFCQKNYPNMKDMEFYCKVMSYEKKTTNWFLILINGSSIQNIEVSFKHFIFSNDYNETLEQEVRELKERRMKQTLDVKKKISRNEPCPCGSGKKYKRCCIKN